MSTPVFKFDDSNLVCTPNCTWIDKDPECKHCEYLICKRKIFRLKGGARPCGITPDQINVSGCQHPYEPAFHHALRRNN